MVDTFDVVLLRYETVFPGIRQLHQTVKGKTKNSLKKFVFILIKK